jgi:hypothetical protein
MLGIPLTAGETTKEKGKDIPPPVDIDAIITAARRKRARQTNSSQSSTDR